MYASLPLVFNYTIAPPVNQLSITILIDICRSKWNTESINETATFLKYESSHYRLLKLIYFIKSPNFTILGKKHNIASSKIYLFFFYDLLIIDFYC